ncbi:MAG: hypothetical protein Q7W51_11405 [Coriobacteriia bacterium]|nr:hypothetical protein [Coriobacteriia bacterium]
MAKDRWSLRNIYLYLVCLITLIMVIVSVVGVVRSAVELAYPDPGYYYDVPKEEGGSSERTAEDIEAERESQEAQSRRYAIIELVGNAAMLLVAGPLYVYHWRKIEVEHVEKPEITPTAAG